MPEPLITPYVLIAVTLSIVGHACQRGHEYRAAKDSAAAISGFVDFYLDQGIHLDGQTFPALARKPLPLPGDVYGLIPPEFLHDVVAAEIAYPDDTVRELVPLSRLNSLKAISVTWNRYSDVELKHFAMFRGLEYLDLSHSCNLTDEGLPQLSALKRLKVLKISADGISEAGIEMLRQEMPKCAINGRMAGRYASEPRQKSGKGGNF
ncbi:MAG: hypothetical protein ISQ06_15295 [Planctomycetaceae bacterium]|jgi:hypothetical protein|nr:hypothetical protein [Planctomycetaceae bacterium]